MTNINPAYERQGNSSFGPSAWELFLLGAGVLESSCVSLLARHTRKGRAIRAWVRDHYQTCYVPESILDVLGLGWRLRFRWQRED
jgi:hypothetical protein